VCCGADSRDGDWLDFYIKRITNGVRYDDKINAATVILFLVGSSRRPVALHEMKCVKFKKSNCFTSPNPVCGKYRVQYMHAFNDTTRKLELRNPLAT
jgi:hypothetical protein